MHQSSYRSKIGIVVAISLPDAIVEPSRLFLRIDSWYTEEAH